MISSRVQSPKSLPRSESFYALKNVSFEIDHGESVGLIGRNGAGKSILLKILSRITRPSAGRVTLHEHVNSFGMFVRLAFSVAVHLTPETLLLDEVLAVGDVVQEYIRFVSQPVG
jgi:ABC-type polysaccharide/polyol phosphate transport system ATPase subunit